MIFVTVGTQFPFDRLVEAIDLWSKENKDVAVFGQIGITKFQPQNIRFLSKMTSEAFGIEFQKAKVIVAHAGMGTIISSLLANKPIIIMPRDSNKNEHRNQHQFSTARKFSGYAGCYVAKDEYELVELLKNIDDLKGGVASSSNIALGNAIDLRIQKLFQN
jgi:UDP-N-acetylglucosamine transferase subunit ALG13